MFKKSFCLNKGADENTGSGFFHLLPRNNTETWNIMTYSELLIDFLKELMLLFCICSYCKDGAANTNNNILCPHFPFQLCVVMWKLSKPLPSNPPESPRFPKQGKRLWNSPGREHTVRLKTLLSVGVCGLTYRPSCTPDVGGVKVVLRWLLFELCPPFEKNKKTTIEAVKQLLSFQNQNSLYASHKVTRSPFRRKKLR